MIFLQLETDDGPVWVSAAAVHAVAPDDSGSVVWVDGHAFPVLARPGRILQLLGKAYRTLYAVDEDLLDEDGEPAIDLRDEEDD